MNDRGESIMSNGTLHHRQAYESVAEGCLLSVEFDYVCQKTPGVYFLNAGVLAAEDGSAAEYAHRIVGATLIVVRLARAEVAEGPPRVTVQSGACASP